MKKNNTAQKSILDAKRIMSALKEGTEKNLQQILAEAISDVIEKDDEEADATEEPIEDDSFEVEDVDTEKDSTDETPEDGEEEGPDAEDSDTENSDDEGDEEWSDEDLEKFKVGDSDFDLTSVDDDTAFDIYSKMGDSDLIHIQKHDGEEDEDSGEDLEDLDSDSEIDDEPDGEIEVDLEGDEEIEDPEEEDDDELDAEVDDEDEDADIDVDIDDEEDLDDDEEDLDIDVDVEDDDEDEDADIDIDVEDDEDTLNEENLGFTDSYQKDVIPGLNVNEPADRKSTRDWDAGVPKGSSRPWAGKGKSDPFTKHVNEGEDIAADGETPADLEESGASRTSVKKSHVVKGDKKRPEGFPARGPQAHREELDESTKARIKEMLRPIVAENKQCKKVMEKITETMQQAYVTNRNYGRILNLFLNEATTKEEKNNIVERFESVKTDEEGKLLFESIKRELNNSHKTGKPRIDEQISAAPSNTVNETVIFQSPERLASISLMERMEKLFDNKPYKKQVLK